MKMQNDISKFKFYIYIYHYFVPSCIQAERGDFVAYEFFRFIE
jgi:hypothetical protein